MGARFVSDRRAGCFDESTIKLYFATLVRPQRARRKPGALASDEDGVVNGGHNGDDCFVASTAVGAGATHGAYVLDVTRAMFDTSSDRSIVNGVAMASNHGK